MPRVIALGARSTSHRPFVLAASLLALALPTRVASGQLGGMIKRAKDKVVGQQVGRQVDKQAEKRAGGATSSSGSVGAPPTFDDVTLELTAERVDQVLRGTMAGRAVLNGENGMQSRAALVARRDELTRQSRTLSDQNAKVIEAYNNRRSEVDRCRYDAMGASSKKRAEDYKAKAMADPAFQEKMMAFAQKYALAQQRNDTAEVRRLQEEYIGQAGGGAKADTAAADAKCGREAPKPAVLAQMQKLDAEAKELSEKIRELESKAAAAEVRASGLEERQFAMARERAEMWVEAVKHDTRPRGFSAAELEALAARRADLEKALL